MAGDPTISRCLPVQLNNPWTMNKPQNLPTRKYENIPRIPIPWFLLIMKIVLMIVALFHMKLESTRWEDIGVFGLFQTMATFLDVSMSMIAILFDRTLNERNDYDKTCTALLFFLGCRTVFLLVGIACSTALNNLSYIYLSATIGYMVIEVVMCRSYATYYGTQFKILEDGLIEDIKTNFGGDHELGEEVLLAFYTETKPEEVFWRGTPAESRDPSIYPRNVYWHLKEGVADNYVAWNAYADMNERINKDFEKMEDLVKRNTELRNDLEKQTRLISQLRRKIRGPTVDCSDVDQIPPPLAAVPAWYPALADGLFVSTEGFTALYVKLGDYREMTDHAVLLRNSISLLEHEKRELKRGLQERKRINNEIVESMINGDEEGNEDDGFQLIRIDDVDY